jgi:hypothetical protein
MSLHAFFMFKFLEFHLKFFYQYSYLKLKKHEKITIFSDVPDVPFDRLRAGRQDETDDAAPFGQRRHAVVRQRQGRTGD